MKITLPFAYEVTVKLRRNRGPVGRHPCSMIEVDIPVVPPQAAPVAAKWFEKGYVTQKGEQRDVRALMEVRHFEAGFYRPLVSSHFESRPATSVETLSDYARPEIARHLHQVFCRDRRTQPISGAMWAAEVGHLTTKLTAGYIERNAEILGSKFDEVLLGLQTALGEYIIVGGGVWTKVAEPVLVLDNPSGAIVDDRFSGNPHRPNRRVGVAGIITQPAEAGRTWSANRDRLSIGGSKKTKTFRLDQYAALNAFIGSTAEPTDSVGRRFERFEMSVDEVEVLLPDTLCFDPDLNEVSRQVDECLRLALRAADDEGLSPFFKEAAAHSAVFKEDGDPDHLVEALAAVQTLYAALENDITDEQSAALESLLDLHDKLPISFDVNPATMKP